MNIIETMEFINSYSKSGKPVSDLSRAEDLMRRIGNPEKQLKFVHIAGTNGKGSTVEYISNALIYSGYRTGQFTSPFVLHYADRIRINGAEIDERSLCEIAEFVRERVGDEEYSQFEITMAIAFLWFEREKCDVVVLECGIGGLLDCTNVIPPPLVSVITSISLDHTAILGDTVEKIAEQKAGIIKTGSAVVVAPECNCQNIFQKKAREVGAEFIVPAEKLPYKPAMMGRGQISNGAAAAEVCRYLSKKGLSIPEECIKKAIETTHVKARCQFINGKPPVIVDGGHNPEGIGNLTGILRRLCVDDKKRLYTVMGMVNTKDYEVGVYEVARYSEVMFTVDDFAPNAVNAGKLAEIAAEIHEAVPCGSLDAAVKRARALALENDGYVVVCGSLYLASEYLNKYEKSSQG